MLAYSLPFLLNKTIIWLKQVKNPFQMAALSWRKLLTDSPLMVDTS